MRRDAVSFTVALVRLPITAVCAVASGIVAMPAAAEASESGRQPDRTAVVPTDNGWVRGRDAGDHVTFAGVPHAAPPPVRCAGRRLISEAIPAVVGGFPLGAHHSGALHVVRDADPPGGQPPGLTPPQLTLDGPKDGGRPPWPSFSQTGSVLGLEAGRTAPTPFAATHRCDVWQGRS